MHALLAITYEKRGDGEQARAHYQHAYDLATAHNPPAAYARRVARAKLQ
jgi:Flp pilus assembly protein TadD